MNQQRDLDALIATWLDDGPVDLPDETRRAIAVGLRTQPRARRVVILGGSSMFALNRLAAAAAVLIAVGALSAFLLSNRAGGPGSVPSPSVSSAPSAIASPFPSPSNAPSPSDATLSTAGWIPFTSSHYGYKIAYPPTSVATQATHSWAFATDRLVPPAPGGAMDVFVGGPNGNQTAVMGFAADVPAGTSEDAWLTSYYAGGAFCPTMPTFVSITVDGHPGRLDPCYDAQAFVFVGNRVYVFLVYRTQEQPLFKAFLSTVKLPATAPSGSPRPS
ncbi:MAG: hypothetical protein QOI00_1269 [Chloroflexota bacterium]|jgi:hypothetical protein|nr:hypothetical protein [Chloroflexota bacterium]